MRGPPRPTVLTLPGDLPGVQSRKVPEGRRALCAKSQGGGRPAGRCLLSARPRTHAFLQLRITRSCSPATALQAASSLVHCSWWVASARQGGAVPGVSLAGPGGTWVHTVRGGRSNSQVSGEASCLQACLPGCGGFLGPPAPGAAGPHGHAGPVLVLLEFPTQAREGLAPPVLGLVPPRLGGLSRLRPGSPRLRGPVPWCARLLPAPRGCRGSLS